MKIQWKQSKVPISYRSSNGCLKMACIGEKYGRSLAVAASHGCCILDLSIGKDERTSLYSHRNIDSFPSSCEEGFVCSDDNTSVGVGANQPKWKMFNKIDEKSFTMQAMAWFERNNSINASSEDILLGVVRYIDISNHCYLAGWSRRR